MPIIARSKTKIKSDKLITFLAQSQKVIEGLKEKIKDSEKGIIGFGTSRQAKKLCIDENGAYKIKDVLHKDAEYKTIVIFKDYKSINNFRSTHEVISQASELLEHEIFTKENSELPQDISARKSFMESYLIEEWGYTMNEVHCAGESVDTSTHCE